MVNFSGLRRHLPRSLFALAVLLLILSFAGPVIAVLASVPPKVVLGALGQPYLLDALRVSLLASFGATTLATLLGIPGGYYLARSRSRWSALWLVVLALPLAFPPVASGIIVLSILGAQAPLGAWLLAHGLRATDSLVGVGIAQFFVAGSFVAISATAAFANLNPIYEDAARTLGASELRIFRHVALPAAAGNLAVGVAFAWLRAIGEYGATSIVAYHPTSLPVALYVTLDASGVRPALAIAYAFIILAALVLSVAWILRRRVVL